MATQTDTLQTDRTEDRLIVTLTNQEMRNALTLDAAKALEAAVTDVDARCLVVQGAGGVFCAGGDVQAMAEAARNEATAERRLEEVALPINRAVQAVAECRVPTVAKVDGAAFGAGAALAIACDIVLASERARIGFGFRQVGLSVDSAVSHLLPRIVGTARAKELVYTGELIDAERAHRDGLFTRVFPDDEFERRAREVIDQVASGPTLALRHSKRLLEADHGSAGAAVDAEAEALRETFASADHAEGVTAFIEERDPEFAGE